MTITIEDFQKVALRIGQIVKAEAHPNADRLLVLQVDLGGEPKELRQVVAGIKPHYAPEALVGKHVVVVTNMQPATLRGIESYGMVLAASQGQDLTLIIPDRPIPPGSTVK